MLTDHLTPTDDLAARREGVAAILRRLPEAERRKRVRELRQMLDGGELSEAIAEHVGLLLGMVEERQVSEAAHTPEPWALADRRGAPLPNVTIFAGNIAVASIEGVHMRDNHWSNWTHETADAQDAVALANGRRIVAAVNACEGISVKSLERGVVADLLTACEAAMEMLDDIGNELAADPRYMAYFGKNGHGLRVVQKMQAAIAKARGTG